MKQSALFLAVVMLLLSIGCGPAKPGKEEVVGCYPYEMSVRVDDHQMTVSWQQRCDRLISGYNIYISETPLVGRYPGPELSASITPFNDEPFPGDIMPDDIEQFIAEGLDNGVKYHVSVRIVFPDRTVSVPSNEVTAVCGPRGIIELPIRYKSANDGFAFTRNSYVPADDLDNDLYFYSRDGVDYLVAPDRLDGFLKANRLRLLPFRGELEHVAGQLADQQAGPENDRIVISRNDWVYMVTPDDTRALVKVLGINGDGDQRRVRLFFAYCPLAGEAIF